MSSEAEGAGGIPLTVSFDDNRLQTMEREILGLAGARDDDVPGELIPSLYFGYLQTSDVAPLGPVFWHNALDVVSLVSLYTDLVHTIARDGRDAAPHVGANLGHLWLQRRRPGRAARILTDALTRDAGGQLPPDTRLRAHRDRVVALKRLVARSPAGERGVLVDRLVAALVAYREDAPDDPAVYVELARVHGRHTRRFAAGLAAARQALRLLAATATEADRGVAERRVQRLADRLAGA